MFSKFVFLSSPFVISKGMSSSGEELENEAPDPVLEFELVNVGVSVLVDISEFEPSFLDCLEGDRGFDRSK